MSSRVMIVEDESVIALDLERRLGRLGYEVVGSVATGEAAVELVQTTNPDLVLMDIRLAGAMDGIEAAEQIRREAQVPIVFLTSYTDDATIQRAKLIEPFGYLVKPFSEGELHSGLQIALHRAEVERQLRDRDAALDRTLRSLGDAVIAADADGTIRFLSPSAEALSGWRSGDAVGRSVFEVLKKIEARRRNGGEPSAEADSAADTLVFRSAAEQQLLEERLAHAQRMEAIGRLAAGLAHDFNNLLTVILGFSSADEDGEPPPEVLKQRLEQIEHAARQSAVLTRQLLALGQRHAPALRPIDLNALLRQMEVLLRGALRDDIELILVPGDGLPSVNADPHQLEQVILNMALNAADAMPRGGRLILMSELAPTPEDQDALNVALSITDTGQGIPPDVLPHIFDPFFTTKEPGKGSGLGLAMAKGIVTQGGGHIEVHSEPGVGTSFTIVLPATSTGAEVPAAAPERPASVAAGEVVLVVDDEPMLLRFIRAALEQQNYIVLAAGGPLQALWIAENFPHDIQLLLTDVVMPRMNGAELAARVCERRPETRVLFMSGYAGDTVLGDFACSKHGFLQKPFAATELFRATREILSED